MIWSKYCSGGTVPSWNCAASDLPCLCQPGGAAERHFSQTFALTNYSALPLPSLIRGTRVCIWLQQLRISQSAAAAPAFTLRVNNAAWYQQPVLKACVELMTLLLKGNTMRSQREWNEKVTSILDLILEHLDNLWNFDLMFFTQVSPRKFRWIASMENECSSCTLKKMTFWKESVRAQTLTQGKSSGVNVSSEVIRNWLSWSSSSGGRTLQIPLESAIKSKTWLILSFFFV